MAETIAEIEERLDVLARGSRGLLRTRFETDPGRLARYSHRVAGIRFDLSRLDIDPDVMAGFGALAEAADLAGWRERLVAGDVVNPSEGRAATHMATRGTGPAPLVAEAEARGEAMRTLAETLRGEPIRHVLHVGIGGSALGPALLLDALGRDADGPEVLVVSNIDGEALSRAMAGCDPAQTLLLVASKTFTTAETMTNAGSALAWMKAAGVTDLAARTVAVTAAPERARDWGAGHVLDFPDTVGGRYSLWTAVGLGFVLRAGWQAWADLLEGAAAMDRHFLDAPFEANMPVLAAMADVWAHRFGGQAVRGVFAYDERLRLLPMFLQQLEMESNGKRVDRDGQPITRPTAPVTWGGTGTDAQHAVFQLLHQGTVPGPVEFVAVRTPGHGLDGAHHRQLLANCLAQGAALMQGRDAATALSLAGGDAALAGARTFPGNRPSATILLDSLDPRTLGALLAFYEHRTFAAAVLMGINPFDQWGVELGKELANAVLGGGLAGADPSTAALMREALG
ncbi:glucose-6-phosphate isomerase [Polymorphobacter sp.]|uniref:glucose-6-phosphate isomerase n=1 Tax=Polymorphobacter sp. TaxID=1909290 RepID=UPI003F6FCD82